MCYTSLSYQVREAGLLFTEACTYSQQHTVVDKAPIRSGLPRTGLVTSVGIRSDGGFVMDKKCSRCGEVKAASEFGKNATRKDGLYDQCKACCLAYREAHRKELAERGRVYRQQHPETRLESERAYRETHRKELLERSRVYNQTHYEEKHKRKQAYNQDHREELNQHARGYRLANPDKVLASKEAYKMTHREEIKEYTRSYRQSNPDKLAAASRAYRQSNRDKLAAASHAYRQMNREKVLDWIACRRARKLAATVEPVSRARVYERDGGRCHICHKKVQTKGWHLDHLIPLSKGGEHSYRNVAVACPKCNMSRSDHGSAQLRLIG
jgi:5-methylcytosine-specific restriction endonuclease McrA